MAKTKSKSNNETKHGVSSRRARNSSRNATDSRVTDNNRSPENNRIIANMPINSNDPDWYFRDPVMKQGLTRLPTMEFLGKNVPLDAAILLEDETLPANYLSQSMLAVYKVNPSPGYSSGPDSAMNQASRMLYSKLSSSNAKTSNYAPQDVSTLILALGEVISMISHLTRCYGVTALYNKMNRGIPVRILSALNIADVTAWTKNLPEFRAELNRVITIANSISFPANIPYFKKCAYVYQHMFVDNPTAMSGLHMMVPNSTWILDEQSYAAGSILKTVNLSSADPNAILTQLKSMIDALLVSATYNYIYADVLNLATRGVLGSELLSFGTIPIDYAVEPVYSDQFLWQIRNATIYGAPNMSDEYIAGGDTPSNDVYPDVNGNSIFYMPSWSYIKQAYIDRNFIEPIIRVPDVGLAEDDLIELLAYSGQQWFNATANTDDSTKWDIYSSIQSVDIPDHYIVSATIYGGTSYSYTFNSNGIGYNTSAVSACGHVTELAAFPLLYIIVSSLGNTRQVPQILSVHGKLNAYTVRMGDAISNVRYAAYMGLFTFE